MDRFDDTSENHHLARQNKISTWALVVGIVSLLVSGGGLYWAHLQLEEAKQQFDVSGPQLEVESSVSMEYSDHDKRVNNSFDQKDAPTITDTMLAQYDEVWLKLRIQNNGRTDTTLTGARVQQGPDTWLTYTTTATDFWCQIARGNVVPCRDALPVPLAPGTAYYLYLPLKYIRQDMKQPAPGSERSVLVEISSTGMRSPTKTVATGIVLTLAD